MRGFGNSKLWGEKVSEDQKVAIKVGDYRAVQGGELMVRPHQQKANQQPYDPTASRAVSNQASVILADKSTPDCIHNVWCVKGMKLITRRTKILTVDDVHSWWAG